MSLHKLSAAISLALSLAALPSSASGEVLVGSIEPATPLGQYMSLEMTIGQTHTLFEMTGPDYSWFAFGFEPNGTMQGYSLIVQGLDDSRTVVEQNLIGINLPGSPQATQDIELVSTSHDAANDLTTVVVRRPNVTGDPLDPDFPQPQNPLPIIWSYDSFSSPQFPNGSLSYHGSSGRGFLEIEFTPIPEPSGLGLGALAVGSLMLARHRRLGRR